MKVSFRNEQNKYKVTGELKKLVKDAVEQSLDYMEFEKNVEISVMFVNNDGIQALNKVHRNIDKVTDVLSFPMFAYDEEGNMIEEYLDYNENGEILLGDVVISLERAAEQAEEYGHSMEREVGFLTVHSMLHLFGYDHMTENDEKEMFEYQTDILNKMGLER